MKVFSGRGPLILKGLVWPTGAIRACGRGADGERDENDRPYGYGSTRSVSVSDVELWIKFRRAENLVVFEVVPPRWGWCAADGDSGTQRTRRRGDTKNRTLKGEGCGTRA